MSTSVSSEHTNDRSSRDSHHTNYNNLPNFSNDDEDTETGSNIELQQQHNGKTSSSVLNQQQLEDSSSSLNNKTSNNNNNNNSNGTTNKNPNQSFLESIFDFAMGGVIRPEDSFVDILRKIICTMYGIAATFGLAVPYYAYTSHVAAEEDKSALIALTVLVALFGFVMCAPTFIYMRKTKTAPDWLMQYCLIMAGVITCGWDIFTTFFPVRSTSIAIALMTVTSRVPGAIPIVFCLITYYLIVEIRDAFNLPLRIANPYDGSAAEKFLFSFPGILAMTLMPAMVAGMVHEYIKLISGAKYSVKMAQEVAELVLMYDTEGVRDALKSAEKEAGDDLEKGLVNAFEQIADNLDQFRPHLPAYVLPSDGADHDDLDLDEEALDLYGSVDNQSAFGNSGRNNNTAGGANHDNQSLISTRTMRAREAKKRRDDLDSLRSGNTDEGSLSDTSNKSDLQHNISTNTASSASFRNNSNNNEGSSGNFGSGNFSSGNAAAKNTDSLDNSGGGSPNSPLGQQRKKSTADGNNSASVVNNKHRKKSIVGIAKKSTNSPGNNNGSNNRLSALKSKTAHGSNPKTGLKAAGFLSGLFVERIILCRVNLIKLPRVIFGDNMRGNAEIGTPLVNKIMAGVLDSAVSHDATVHAFIADSVAISWNAAVRVSHSDLKACRFLMGLNDIVKKALLDGSGDGDDTKNNKNKKSNNNRRKFVERTKPTNAEEEKAKSAGSNVSDNSSKKKQPSSDLKIVDNINNNNNNNNNSSSHNNNKPLASDASKTGSDFPMPTSSVDPSTMSHSNQTGDFSKIVQRSNDYSISNNNKFSNQGSNRVVHISTDQEKVDLPNAIPENNNNNNNDSSDTRIVNIDIPHTTTNSIDVAQSKTSPAEVTFHHPDQGHQHSRTNTPPPAADHQKNSTSDSRRQDLLARSPTLVGNALDQDGKKQQSSNNTTPEPNTVSDTSNYTSTPPVKNIQTRKNSTVTGDDQNGGTTNNNNSQQQHSEGSISNTNTNTNTNRSISAGSSQQTNHSFYTQKSDTHNNSGLAAGEESTTTVILPETLITAAAVTGSGWAQIGGSSKRQQFMLSAFSNTPILEEATQTADKGDFIAVCRHVQQNAQLEFYLRGCCVVPTSDILLKSLKNSNTVLMNNFFSGGIGTDDLLDHATVMMMNRNAEHYLFENFTSQQLKADNDLSVASSVSLSQQNQTDLLSNQGLNNQSPNNSNMEEASHQDEDDGRPMRPLARKGTATFGAFGKNFENNDSNNNSENNQSDGDLQVPKNNILISRQHGTIAPQDHYDNSKNNASASNAENTENSDNSNNSSPIFPARGFVNNSSKNNSNNINNNNTDASGNSVAGTNGGTDSAIVVAGAMEFNTTTTTTSSATSHRNHQQPLMNFVTGNTNNSNNMMMMNSNSHHPQQPSNHSFSLNNFAGGIGTQSTTNMALMNLIAAQNQKLHQTRAQTQIQQLTKMLMNGKTFADLFREQEERKKLTLLNNNNNTNQKPLETPSTPSAGIDSAATGPLLMTPTEMTPPILVTPADMTPGANNNNNSSSTVRIQLAAPVYELVSKKKQRKDDDEWLYVIQNASDGITDRAELRLEAQCTALSDVAAYLSRGSFHKARYLLDKLSKDHPESKELPAFQNLETWLLKLAKLVAMNAEKFSAFFGTTENNVMNNLTQFNSQNNNNNFNSSTSHRTRTSSSQQNTGYSGNLSGLGQNDLLKYSYQNIKSKTEAANNNNSNQGVGLVAQNDNQQVQPNTLQTPIG